MKKLLLHTCCGPCATHSIDHFQKEYEVTLFFYNPCIMPKKEYEKRKQAMEKYGKFKKILYFSGEYDNDNWLAFIKGFEHEKEGGVRCVMCYQFRLQRTAQEALIKGYDCFSTTLTISPHKNSKIINKLGQEIAENVGIEFIQADLKKEDGFKKSTNLSKKHDIYRQSYCGCKFSMHKEH